MRSRSERNAERIRIQTGQLKRRHAGDQWCNIETSFPPSIVMAACDKVEKESFGAGSDGVRAASRRNARTLAALLEFTDLRVIDGGRMLGINRDAAWNLRRKWVALDEKTRQRWLKVVYERMQ